MGRQSKVRSLGFTLLEMLMSMALGVVVFGLAVDMYRRGVNATFIVSQRAEMQQDFRAASNMLTKDISLAGASMGQNVQIALPSGNGVQVPVYGCDQTPRCYINGGAVAFPTPVGGGGVPFLYGLIPGQGLGPTIAGPVASDIISVANLDTNFLLNCYNATVINNITVQFVLRPINDPLNPRPAGCIVPANLPDAQAINDPVVGLTPGDLVELSLTSVVIGEVTNVIAAGPATYNVVFATGDPMRMNQPAAAAGSLGTIAANTVGTANRINLITYFIDNSFQPPRLMRQVSGHTPIPVAENVSFLQFSYDLFNSDTGTFFTNQADGGVSQNLTPSQITKINIKHMSMASTVHGASGYQGLDLTTSVSARDLTFKNDYVLKQQ